MSLPTPAWLTLSADERLLWSQDRKLREPLKPVRSTFLALVLTASAYSLADSFALTALLTGVASLGGLLLAVLLSVPRSQKLQQAVTSQRVSDAPGHDIWYSEFTSVSQQGDCFAISTHSDKAGLLGPLENPEHVLDLIERHCV
ncbi:hypothetical protein [Candidatus Halocynthiibacter alkanivorans]|uniref:hypothetical protein n=1 Tax=Candidatus Halocynthiibacter alkanivorans TaxID=2267619 RepID=UPI000DF2E392|nr:hypothetical protein [Candidatus Halocynthiibacter alkanivorans]